MKNKIVKTAICAVVGPLFGGALFAGIPPAEAHHSFAMFDSTRTIEISGTIGKFEWTNPHIYIWVYVKNAKGEQVLWGIEGATLTTLARRGWTKETVKPGEKVTLTIRPLKDGRTGGSFVRLVKADGTRYGNGEGNN